MSVNLPASFASNAKLNSRKAEYSQRHIAHWMGCGWGEFVFALELGLAELSWAQDFPNWTVSYPLFYLFVYLILLSVFKRSFVERIWIREVSGVDSRLLLILFLAQIGIITLYLIPSNNTLLLL